jgi:hypothetical protein
MTFLHALILDSVPNIELIVIPTLISWGGETGMKVGERRIIRVREYS